MGLFGSIFNSIGAKIEEEKKIAEDAYNEVMRYSNNAEHNFKYGLERAINSQKKGQKMKLLGYLRAVQKLGKSEDVTDFTLKREYDYMENEVGGMVFSMMQKILCSRGLLEQDGDTYIKTW